MQQWSRDIAKSAQHVHIHSNLVNIPKIINTQIPSNIEAIQLINNLYVNTNKHSLSHDEQKLIVQNAFDIYDHVIEEPNSSIINTLLKVSLFVNQPHNMLLIWHDIQKWKQYKYEKDNFVSFPLLLLCCIKSWNADIHKCINILEWMIDCNTSIKLNGLTVSHLIAKCKNETHINSLKYIHSLLNKNFIENNNIKSINTALIAGYGRCGDIQSSLNVFHTVNDINPKIIYVNAMMNAFICNQDNQKAIHLYDKYNELHNNFSHFLAIKASKNLKDIQTGKDIIANKLDINQIDLQIKNGLIDFYGHFGDMNNAMDIFNSITHNEMDKYCLGSMMKVCIYNGCYTEALNIYSTFKSKIPSNLSDLYAIIACTYIGDFSRGKQIHKSIKVNLYDIRFQNRLIHFYGHFKDINSALDIFNNIIEKKKNFITYNSMIQAFINCDLPQKALNLYNRTDLTEHDSLSHALAIKACTKLNHINKGKEIHKLVENDLNVPLKSALIGFYGSFDIITAWHIFNSIHDKYKTSKVITTMMRVCINNDCSEDTLELYDKYNNNDDVMQILAIKACTNLHLIDNGKEIHSNIDMDKVGLDKIVDLKTSLISFYGNALDIDTALDLFNSIKETQKDIIVINAMMGAYDVNKMNKECTDLYLKYNSYIKTDIITYKIMITSCSYSSYSSAFQIGDNIYSEIKTNQKHMLFDNELQIKLIIFYGKYGVLQICEEIFDFNLENNSKQNVQVWNSMIRAYAVNDELDKAFNLYYKMNDDNDIIPDERTYIILINGCSHLGELNKARNIWLNDITDKTIKYATNIITTMIDCFARRGYLNESYEYITKFEKYNKTNKEVDIVWNPLMNGCIKSNDILMARHVYDEMEKRFKDKKNVMTGAKVLLYNILQC